MSSFFSQVHHSVIESLLKKHGKIMILKLYSENHELLLKYMEEVEDHNNKIIKQDFPDSGFDLYLPHDTTFTMTPINKIDYEIKLSAFIIDNHNNVYPTGYYVHPRSSISKTPLRLANSTGIIDSGYRGNIQGLFDLKGSQNFQANKFDRFLQICSPDLRPIIVEIVSKEKDLSEKTQRGYGGIGSTGV